MRRTSALEVLRLALVLFLLTGVPGCRNPFDPPIDPGPPPLPPPTRESKMDLMHFFAKAYEERDLIRYDECLHEDYQFWFWEDNVGDPGWPLGEWIDKAKDVELTEAMFESDEVIAISAEFSNQTLVPGATSDEERFWETNVVADGEEFVIYEADFAVDLRVTTESPDAAITHWVNGRAEIFIRVDPVDPKLWTIWKVEDKGNVNKGAEAVSWGKLKHDFR